MKYDNSHLTLDERKIIQTGIENRSTKVSIANTIGKDPTTVAKEIKKHRILHPRNSANYPNVCIHRKECGNCFSKCDKYEEPKCNKRDKSPGACNKCPNSIKCHLDKYFYYAEKVNAKYLYDLHNSREGINLTTTERKELASILVPLINQDNLFIKFFLLTLKLSNLKNAFIITSMLVYLEKKVLLIIL